MWVDGSEWNQFVVSFLFLSFPFVGEIALVQIITQKRVGSIPLDGTKGITDTHIEQVSIVCLNPLCFYDLRTFDVRGNGFLDFTMRLEDASRNNIRRKRKKKRERRTRQPQCSTETVFQCKKQNTEI